MITAWSDSLLACIKETVTLVAVSFAFAHSIYMIFAHDKKKDL
ncbi:hypothetical protein HMPREF1985_01360 [Mitsuokella sp. oral taxon 131 str. W9106]|nr:hypothetical protein HMPREF1985_01360 [Mitsuokella sp. oral taxon 131 str. W9106]